ncbi:MAG: pyrroloquinoline quinone biosynthesis peptide chaperone PqqD [Kiloniellaceae bacterium]
MEKSARITITEDSVPGLPRGVKLRFDKQRDQWVLLAPERLFVLDAIALEIVKRCDGEASVAQIVNDLAETFAAPRDVILKDVGALLQDLADKRILSAGRAA